MQPLDNPVTLFSSNNLHVGSPLILTAPDDESSANRIQIWYLIPRFLADSIPPPDLTQETPAYSFD
ncbi:uncharacterized protein PHALS_00152 [Plasmopara halstedii]|uniref:Uncharacterized protein n=1 Tax=Plasmopara halstedii TaxID=4781 RepID=A0A0P1A6L8_PLAHL|nr:uncharacterized protein PHALS_00152 [Plasmopara halstedii]CEG35823.1 hypothetical protein PHALS_00152 [Plasmopara halstedii]|eukprot:XP_024572192.1 hypothetical protein PHALS_00152 [Plasmopara halstedii]